MILPSDCIQTISKFLPTSTSSLLRLLCKEMRYQTVHVKLVEDVSIPISLHHAIKLFKKTIGSKNILFEFPTHCFLSQQQFFHSLEHTLSILPPFIKQVSIDPSISFKASVMDEIIRFIERIKNLYPHLIIHPPSHISIFHTTQLETIPPRITSCTFIIDGEDELEDMVMNENEEERIIIPSTLQSFYLKIKRMSEDDDEETVGYVLDVSSATSLTHLSLECIPIRMDGVCPLKQFQIKLNPNHYISREHQSMDVSDFFERFPLSSFSTLESISINTNHIGCFDFTYNHQQTLPLIHFLHSLLNLSHLRHLELPSLRLPSFSKVESEDELLQFSSALLSLTQLTSMRIQYWYDLNEDEERPWMITLPPHLKSLTLSVTLYQDEHITTSFIYPISLQTLQLCLVAPDWDLLTVETITPPLPSSLIELNLNTTSFIGNIQKGSVQMRRNQIPSTIKNVSFDSKIEIV